MEPLEPRAEEDLSIQAAGLAADGRAATFEELFEQVAGGAYRLAVTLTRNRSEAEDLLQEAALSAYRSFASFARGTNFKAWLYRILINRHYYKHRQKGSRPATVELEDTPELYLYARRDQLGAATGEDPAASLMRKMTAEQVRRAVASLPPEYGAAVSLFFLEELPYEAVAGVLGCPVGTVRSRLHRGRRMLQKLLWQMALEAGLVGGPQAREATV